MFFLVECRWHDALHPCSMFSSIGSVFWHISITDGHLGAKAHPVGKLMSLGGIPGIPIKSFFSLKDGRLSIRSLV